jgi:hypothetical protein
MDAGIAIHFRGRGLENLRPCLASPSMLMAPCTLVLVVWTGSC